MKKSHHIIQAFLGEKRLQERQKTAASGLDKLGVTAARNREAFHIEKARSKIGKNDRSKNVTQ